MNDLMLAALTTIIAQTLSVILFVGAVAKFSDLSGFAAIAANYWILRKDYARLVAYMFPLVEALSALMLLIRMTGAIGAWCALALIAGATLAVAINLKRGRYDIDCGCGGFSKHSISEMLVVRNVLLMGACGFVAAFSGAAEVLSFSQMLVAFAATLVVSVLYFAADQLIANRTKIRMIEV